jgi:hypothetical protein
MGNWRRVRIVGTCHRKDVDGVRTALTLRSDYSNFHCLVCTGSICGLPNWGRENIDVVGNLAERDYDADSVAEALQEIVDHHPTLDVRIHVGDENEGSRCVATVYVDDIGVQVGVPEIQSIPEVSDSQMAGSLASQLRDR